MVWHREPRVVLGFMEIIRYHIFCVFYDVFVNPPSLLFAQSFRPSPMEFLVDFEYGFKAHY